MLGLAVAGEGGEPDLGDLGVGDPPLLVLVPELAMTALAGSGPLFVILLAPACRPLEWRRRRDHVRSAILSGYGRCSLSWQAW